MKILQVRVSTHWKRILFFLLGIFFFGYSLIIYLYCSGNQEYEMSNAAKQGKLLWQNYNCNACHQLYGLGGYMGPDLTNIISNPNKGRNYAAIFIKNGTERMPNLNLDSLQISNILEYLDYVDKSGKYPDRNANQNWYGEINPSNR